MNTFLFFGLIAIVSGGLTYLVIDICNHWTPKEGNHK